MNEERLGRIEQKIDELSKVREDIAAMRQVDKHHQQNMDLFLQTNWPQAMAKIDANSTRIAEVEVDVAKLKTLVVVWGSILSVGVPALVAFATKYLTN